jgi:hypothetical protein
MALVPLYSPVAFSGALPCSLKRDPSVVKFDPGAFVRFEQLYLPVMLGPTSQEFSEDSVVETDQILVRSLVPLELMEPPICPMAEIVALQTQEVLPLMHQDALLCTKRTQKCSLLP